MTYIGMKTCPVCEGDGEVEYEVPVPDYGSWHGGFFGTEWGTCDRCSGSGEVEDWEDDDE